ncbi:MAG: hypothetical protein JXB13_13815, partial [Phycisphaerae bacterium]|nr:hypothetical protein [Phycisphaerae bacterium]
MKRTMLAVVVACMFAGTALGESVIQYTLDLPGVIDEVVYGDNQVEEWELGNNAMYLQGLPYDGVGEAYTCMQGTTITWDAVVAVSGEHSGEVGTGLPGGYVPNGAANLVFSLTVHKDNPENPPETTPIFFSTMNDGDTQTMLPGGEDPLEMAAFCHIYDIGGNGPPSSGTGFGRLFDPPATAGPGMDRVQYPSTATHGGGRRSVLDTPPYTEVGGATGVPAGQLVGMGAGYSDQILGGGIRMPGVGLDGAGTCYYQLLHLPNFEGQINTSAMAGTYYLKLTPGGGNNILSGDFNCEYDSLPRFAWEANQANGDTIKFEVIELPQCESNNITLWSSVRDHGGTCGELALSSAPGTDAEIVETRYGGTPGVGGVQKIVVDFDSDISTHCWDGDEDGAAIVITANHTPPPACFTVVPGSVSAVGTTLTFLVTGPPSANCQVDISGAVDGIQNDPTCDFRVCDGNINYDTGTDLTDASLMNTIQGTIPDPENHPDLDVNCDCQ